MKAFRFSLQAVQLLRERQEQVARERYAQTIAARQQVIDRLRLIQLERTAAANARLAEQRRGAPVGRLAQVQDYLVILDRRQQLAEEEWRQAETMVQAAFQQWLAARQKREAVDRFEARQRERYQRAVDRAEQKRLDDLARPRPLPAVGEELSPALVEA
jgi:flagellar export protein FliJ